MTKKWFCRHCAVEIRQDGDGVWIDCETHSVCDTPAALRHEPQSYAVTLPDAKYHRVNGEWVKQ